MNHSSSIGRPGAVARIDGATALPGAHRAGGASFGRSLEYVIGSGVPECQRQDGGNAGRIGKLHAVDKSAQPVDGALQSMKPQPPVIQDNKSRPFTPGPAASRNDPGAASGAVTQPARDTAAPLAQKNYSYGYGTPGGYQFDYAPSTLDPGSMAFLLAWLGGGGPQVNGQSVREQQQSYLDTYRTRYPNGVPGVNSYITSTTKYHTSTS